MNAATMLAKQKGDRVSYCGIALQIIDWQCLPEPQFNRQNERIDAEPVVYMPANGPTVLRWQYWPEVDEV